MRIFVVLSAFMLSACVGWTGAQPLSSPDDDLYPGSVATKPGVLVLGVLPGMVLPETYTVADCFGQRTSVKEHLNEAGVVNAGADPLTRVCRQYTDIDLRDYPPETINCFAVEKPAEAVLDGTAYRHPWLSDTQNPICTQLIADINAAKER